MGGGKSNEHFWKEQLIPAYFIKLLFWVSYESFGQYFDQFLGWLRLQEDREILLWALCPQASWIPHAVVLQELLIFHNTHLNHH